ncbi:uncharacterized protein EHS24_001734 [Apiotrichum porosum]|uniref:CASTOR ACT domain-containing protein n=1 Tax=Apiotrichum porosum TaxID=105984 RepID=A0A427XIT5_9TREE|nr:uncharacterized protein EHS24_001734 [Apiotrichum porosum]RSH78819.1 hypothetical protein EHS24_001734 [Apiotrichum porosum]
MPAAPADSFALDKSNPVLALSAAVGGLYVHRFPAGTPVPPELFSNVGAADDFVSVTRVGNELSIVATKGATSNVGMPEPSAEHCGGPWTAMKVKGPLEHHMVGVLSALTDCLKRAGVSIFAISTWDTDYILITTDTLEKAKTALQADGWTWNATRLG